MSGIYLHIPFCKQACHYCNFHFSTSLKYKGELLDAMHKEIALQKDYLGGEAIQTIYFGGGTPSLLSADEINGLLAALGKYHDISGVEEVTLEANPDDLGELWLKNLQNTSVNRLSIGVQSFFERDLQYMNRAHDAQEAKRCILDAQDAGYTNLSIDLIYGTPTMSESEWEENLATVFELHIPHISCYALTVEPKTALAHFVQAGKAIAPSDESAAKQFEVLTKRMLEQGYEHYEISNFCLPNSYSKHNSAYWTGKKYLGIGPSAHSFNGKTRQWNKANNALYIKELKQDNLPFELEHLSPKDRYNEYLLTTLRTKWGADMDKIKAWGQEAQNHFLQTAQPFLDKGLMKQNGTFFMLTNEGKFLSDGIISDLFLAKC